MLIVWFQCADPVRSVACLANIARQCQLRYACKGSGWFSSSSSPRRSNGLKVYANLKSPCSPVADKQSGALTVLAFLAVPAVHQHGQLMHGCFRLLILSCRIPWHAQPWSFPLPLPATPAHTPADGPGQPRSAGESPAAAFPAPVSQPDTLCKPQPQRQPGNYTHALLACTSAVVKHPYPAALLHASLRPAMWWIGGDMM